MLRRFRVREQTVRTGLVQERRRAGEKGLLCFRSALIAKMAEVGLEGLLRALEFEKKRTLPRVELRDVEFVE